jgi:hypothetical protein
MCTTVFTDEKDIWTVKQLRKLLGAENVVEDVSFNEMPRRPLEDDECLCWVDVPASAEKAGWIAEHDDFGYRLRKK